jgi:hypothetical protein
MRRIITTELDGNSMCVAFAIAMANSIEQNSPGEHVRVHAFNWTAEQIQMFPKNVELIHVCRKGMKWIEAVHSQATNMLRALEEGFDVVAHFDVDTLVRAPLSRLWEGDYPNKIKIIYRRDQPSKRRVQNGIYVVGNGNRMIGMMRALEERMLANLQWYEDQKQLWKAVKKHKIEMIHLNKVYNDRHMNEGSVVWHCCLKNKRGNVDWNREFDYYSTLNNG